MCNFQSFLVPSKHDLTVKACRSPILNREDSNPKLLFSVPGEDEELQQLQTHFEDPGSRIPNLNTVQLSGPLGFQS